MRSSTVVPLSDSYRAAILRALFPQILCALLCLLLLDGGRMARACGVALLGFWAAAAFLMARRPNAPQRGEILFLRWGFWPLFALMATWAQFA